MEDIYLLIDLFLIDNSKYTCNLKIYSNFRVKKNIFKNILKQDIIDRINEAKDLQS